MITEDYVSFEVAKLLKEKGFDAECRAAYTNYGQLFTTQIQQYITNVVSSKGTLWDCIAPTHQMAKKWLREEHNLYIEIFVTWRDKIPHYQWRINNLITQDTIVDTPCLEKPEEAVEAALKYSLENLI